MTASLTFAPSVLAFICEDGSFVSRMMFFGLLLPGVSLLVMAFLGLLTLPETVRGFKAAKMLGKATNETEARELEEAEQKVAAQQQEEKSKFQLIKIFEVTGESMPSCRPPLSLKMQLVVWLAFGHSLSVSSTKIHGPQPLWWSSQAF